MATKRKPRKGKTAPRTYWAVEVDCDWAPNGFDIVTEDLRFRQIRIREHARKAAAQMRAEGWREARVVRVAVVERGSR